MFCVAVWFLHKDSAAGPLQPINDSTCARAEFRDRQTEPPCRGSAVRHGGAGTDLFEDWIGDRIAITAEKRAVLAKKITGHPAADITLRALGEHAQQRGDCPRRPDSLSIQPEIPATPHMRFERYVRAIVDRFIGMSNPIVKKATLTGGRVQAGCAQRHSG